jgi:hypothetical protein
VGVPRQITSAVDKNATWSSDNWPIIIALSLPSQPHHFFCKLMGNYFRIKSNEAFLLFSYKKQSKK